MVEDNSGTLRTVAWSELCPWLSLVRVFRLAISFRLLLLAAAGVVVMAVGWWLFGWVFSADENAVRWMGPLRGHPLAAIVSAVPDHPGWSTGKLPPPPDDTPAVSPGAAPPPAMPTEPDAEGFFTTAGAGDPNPLTRAWGLLSQPLRVIFSREIGLAGLACALLTGLWTVAVWAFFGGAITRIVAVQLACEERVSISAALRFACRKWLAYFAAPLFPLIGAVLAAVPMFPLGLVLRADFGVLLMAFLWPLFLVLGLLMALLLLGVLFGWPLMWSTISTEGTDSFDALSRSYAYVFQRPLHYLFYLIVAGVLGVLGWLLVSQFAAGVVGLAYWATSWGGGGPRLGSIASGAGLTGMAAVGAGLIHFWAGCVKLLATGFVFSYFWTAAAAIYFLLRRQVDATEMDEVFLEEQEQSYGLPPLKTDSAGAPMVDEPGEAAPDAEKPSDQE
jgi:hypothetical protein